MAIPNGTGVWNLGGYTLSVLMDGYDPDLQTKNVTISNGTFAATVNTYNGNTKGYVQIYKLNGRDGLNLDLGNTCLRLTTDGVATSQVCDFTANARNEQGSVYSYSTSRLQIYGTFTPQNVRGLNMTMMDGSTLNLSRLTGTFNCTFTNPKYNNKTDGTLCNLQFATDSTITVNLDGRTDLKTIAKSESPYIVTWATKPADTTTFVLDEVTSQYFKCEVTDAGLLLKKTNGLVIIVK